MSLEYRSVSILEQFLLVQLLSPCPWQQRFNKQTESRIVGSSTFEFLQECVHAMLSIA